MSVVRARRPDGTVENIQAVVLPDGLNRPVPQEVESEAPELAFDYREAIAVYPKASRLQPPYHLAAYNSF